MVNIQMVSIQGVQGTRRRTTAWSTATSFVTWVFVLVVAAVLVAAVAVPRLSGSTPYTILTGSMRPTLPPGTLVVVKPVDVDRLAAGDVITYQLRSGDSTTVTHRVVAVSSTLAGNRTLTTQGDANTAPDALPVQDVQVRGKVWYSVPLLGHVNTWFSGDQRRLATIVVAGFLALYALVMFTGAVADRRRARTDRPERSPTS